METGLLKGEAFRPFGVGLLEYLLVVSPDAAVYDKVVVEKRHFYEEYGEKIAIKSKPHITVANFLAMERMEVTIAKWIQRICGLRRGFDVMLNNYSSFLSSHTIYIRVQDHSPFVQLAKDLKVINEYVKSNHCPPAHIVSRPHLTIARRIDPIVYEKAIMDYSQRMFHDFFSVKQLILLRRDRSGGGYKTINIFPLLPPNPNKGPDSYQTDLFN